MQQLSTHGQQSVEDLAQRYGVSTDAVTTLLRAVMNGQGTMAQFSHPELGGSGQWMRGGMTMVGDMFNQSLKSKVDGLCSELSALMSGPPLFAAPPPGPVGDGASLFGAPFGSGNWWPAELGAPGSSGSQNDIRYAVFPGQRRLAIDIAGRITVYDTLDHQIGGVSQQQSGESSVTFTSQYGTVRLDALPIVSGGARTPPGVSAPDARTTSDAGTGSADSELFATIEKLAELRQRGVLSDEEFAAKKAALLARI